MRKTFVTKMPDKAGAFLEAGRIVRKYNGNITRVNYNKALDVHTLFLEAEAEKEALEEMEAELFRIGYLESAASQDKIMVVEFTLRDVPGTVLPILEILHNLAINICYMNSAANESGYQNFKMGLFVEDTKIAKELLDRTSRLCAVKILDYDLTEKLLDNTVFYVSFTNKMRTMLDLSQEEANEFLINSNHIMQLLDEKDESPFKTFDYVAKFAGMLKSYKNEHFMPDITSRKVSPHVVLTVIEPICGSNMYILDDGEHLLAIDGGFMNYREEMRDILDKLFGYFTARERALFLTHADIYHCGTVDFFDKIYVSANTYRNFALEHEGKANFREQNPLHAPYVRLSKIISGYKPPKLDKMAVVGEKTDEETMSVIGEMDFADLHFVLYEGNGGHVKGETILKCTEHKLIFTGDNLVNIKGFSKGQRQFNELAPYLMQSVNMDSKEASRLRVLIENTTKGYWVCPGHGPVFKNE